MKESFQTMEKSVNEIEQENSEKFIGAVEETEEEKMISVHFWLL